jgi:hypothetical protein
MQLQRIYPQALSSLRGEKARCFSGVKIFYVYTGRNAWHSTWSQRYHDGCMHTALGTAQDYAEKQRKQGSVFYIEERPALAFESENQTLIITQVNAATPLGHYSAKALPPRAGIQQTVMEGSPDSYLTIGAVLDGVALSFNHDSRFWRISPPRENSIILLRSPNPQVVFQDLTPEKLALRRSYSNGPRYRLGWSLLPSRRSSEGVTRLLAEADCKDNADRRD